VLHRTATVAAVFIGVALGLAACSSSSVGKKDTGAKKDRTAQPPEGGLPDTSATPDIGAQQDKGPAPDRGKQPDSASKQDKGKLPDWGSSGCDPTCVADDPTTCVQDSNGDCVECLTSAQCTQNPGAYGPTCDTSQSYCTCSGNADCANNNWGHTCDSSFSGCVCNADTECASSVFGSKCDSAYQMCGCTSGADCKAPYGTCDTNMGICTK
jgi:hypothetical protein